MALFLSTYVNKIDKKGRVSVPALYRQTLKDQDFHGVVVFRSFKVPALEVCGVDRMQQLANSLDEFDQFSDEQENLAATIFADARPLAFDSEGRIMLPEDLCHHAGLTDQAAFVGKGVTFQIWNPTEFTTHQDGARNRAKTQGVSLKIRNDGGQS